MKYLLVGRFQITHAVNLKHCFWTPVQLSFFQFIMSIYYVKVSLAVLANFSFFFFSNHFFFLKKKIKEKTANTVCFIVWYREFCIKCMLILVLLAEVWYLFSNNIVIIIVILFFLLSAALHQRYTYKKWLIMLTITITV